MSHTHHFSIEVSGAGALLNVDIVVDEKVHVVFGVFPDGANKRLLVETMNISNWQEDRADLFEDAPSNCAVGILKEWVDSPQGQYALWNKAKDHYAQQFHRSKKSIEKCLEGIYKNSPEDVKERLRESIRLQKEDLDNIRAVVKSLKKTEEPFSPVPEEMIH